MTHSGTNIRIVFFGNERLATGTATSCPLLSSLISANYDVAAVVANYTRSSGRKKSQLEVAELAKKHNIPVLLPTKPGDIIDTLKAYRADVAVLAAYGRIVPQSVIDLFPAGIVNVHPSLLPKHRGPTPIESVILSGTEQTGVSVMSLAKEMDAGPVYAQSMVDLAGNETKQQLADHLADIGSQMITELLPKIVDGSVVAIPQDHSTATYDNLLQKTDGIINWSLPAKKIEQQIRAYAGWPGSRTQILDKQVIVKKASVVAKNGIPGSVEQTKNELFVHCAQDALKIEELQPAGKKSMSSMAFLAGINN